ncbi:subtilisin-like protease-like protein, partial [Trifolium pratense]
MTMVKELRKPIFIKLQKLIMNFFNPIYEKARGAMIYSYTRNINGFAAILEEKEAASIAEHPEVVSVLLNRGRNLHTTHSWEFMSMEYNGVVPSESLFRKARYGEDVIIGNLDSGVWPESPSFRDEGIGPIPSRWKGKCPTTDFRCN